VDQKHEHKTSGHGIGPGEKMFIAISFDITGKDSQIKRRNGQGIQRCKTWKNSRETDQMSVTRVILPLENDTGCFQVDVARKLLATGSRMKMIVFGKRRFQRFKSIQVHSSPFKKSTDHHYIIQCNSLQPMSTNNIVSPLRAYGASQIAS
jgi:hypothetical protein